MRQHGQPPAVGQTLAGGSHRLGCVLSGSSKIERMGREFELMNHFRGMLMLVASAIAFYRGWKIHTGPTALLGYGLGVLAFGLAAWHLTRRSDARRA
jgi:hypothetical protein